MEVTIFNVLLLLSYLGKCSTLTCNGIDELCDLNIKQVTLAGTHNSGAGFDGILKYHSGLGKIPAGSCFYRNQDKDFTAQLNLGIRYFDIDACWENWYKPNSAWICHSDAYAGSIEKMLGQIDKWMNEPTNRNEVIVIHFNRDYAKANADLTGKHIIKQLTNKWGPTTSRLQTKQLSIQPSLNVKLRQAITNNQRIYIIMHSGLTQGNRKSWINSHYTVGYTWTSKTWIGSNGCWGLVEAMGEKRCEREAYADLVRYDLYLSSGLCVSELASKCNQYVSSGVEKCFKGTVKQRKTVNFLLVDYADGKVIDAARKQNVKNVKMYLGKDI